MYVCICKAVSARELEEMVADGATSFEEIQGETGAASCCGTCEPCVRAHMDDLLNAPVGDFNALPA
jgi:bacterioferritin-associated ferredoxin